MEALLPLVFKRHFLKEQNKTQLNEEPTRLQQINSILFGITTNCHHNSEDFKRGPQKKVRYFSVFCIKPIYIYIIIFKYSILYCQNSNLKFFNSCRFLSID